MMQINLLDRYIVRNVLLQFLLVMTGLIAIYLLVDFVERIDDFQEAGKSMGLAGSYFLLKIPLIFHQLSPVAILLSGVISLGLLYRRMEIMSLNAAGISLFRVIMPILAASVLATLLAVANAQWILPVSKVETDRIWLKEVKNKVVGGIQRGNSFFYKGKEGIYTFRSKTTDRLELHNLSYTVWDGDYRASSFLRAEMLSWNEGIWTARNGRIKTFRPDGSYRIEIFTEKELTLPEKPAAFFSPVTLQDHLSLSRLIKMGLKEKREGENAIFIEMNRRLSLIFLGIPLLILAVPVMLILHRRFSWELTMTIPISCLIAFTAWAGWNGAQALSKAELLAPVPASWSLHIAMITVGLLLINRQSNI